MKSLKLGSFFIYAAVLVGAATGADVLPVRDPHPAQSEAILGDLSTRVAVPFEATSYFSLAGFTTPTPESTKKGDASLEFCHSDQWSTACLTALIIYRCGQYTFPLTPYGCALGAAAFVDTLEMKRINVVVENQSYSLPVIFTKRLEKMIQTPAIQKNIQTLRYLLAASAKEKYAFDLWEWMLSVSKNDRTQATESLAVLLQDTSAIEIQVQYLKGIAKAHHFNAATMKAITDLDEVLYQLDYEVLVGNQWKSWLKLYPWTKNIEADTTPLIYHFYPMSFAAHVLESEGLGNRLSSFIPFLFNTEYLAQTLDAEAWPLHHPKPFDINADWIKWKMRDAYSGYAGALWGVHKTDSLPGLKSFQNAYAKAPYETMRRLFWSMPNGSVSAD